MRHTLLYFAVFGLYAGSALASGGPPAPFFGIPSYIDPDYKAPDYSEFSYGQVAKFNLILRQYGYVPGDAAPEVFEWGKPVLVMSGESEAQKTARDAAWAKEPERYGRYQEGADAFYKNDYTQALVIFEALRDEPESWKSKISGWLHKQDASWLREAATYMVARCKLVAAQQNWDGFSDPTAREENGTARVDQPMLNDALQNYQRYLREYPHGFFADSALHMQRKIFRLSGKQAELDAALRAAVGEVFPASAASQPPANSNPNLLAEFEHYFHGQVDVAKDAPLLVAFAWLGTQIPSAGEMTALEKREKDFTAYPDLFQFTRALGLYRMGNYQRLLDVTPDMPGTEVLAMSTALLRALALAKTGKVDEAMHALEEMQKLAPHHAPELHMVQVAFAQGNGLSLFAPSHVISEKVLRSVAQFGMADAVLREGIDSAVVDNGKKMWLVDELARRYALGQKYEALAVLLKAYPGSVFDPVAVPAAVLAKNPHNASALVDMGEFLYQHYITPRSTFEGYDHNHWEGDAFSELKPYCPPCGTVEREKDMVAPIAFFSAAADVVRASGKKDEAEAKALHYLVKCERHGGEFEDRCAWHTTWDQNKDGQGKAYFLRLHKLYPSSAWARKTPYYYD